MRRYIANRILQMIPVLLFVSVMIFALVRILPNDPIYSRIGEDSEALTAEDRDRIEHELGLDRALPIQYLDWMKGIVTLDWGKSFQNKLPVTQELKTRLPHTLQLAATAFIISLTLGLIFGVIAALKRNTI